MSAESSEGGGWIGHGRYERTFRYEDLNKLKLEWRDIQKSLAPSFGHRRIWIEAYNDLKQCINICSVSFFFELEDMIQNLVIDDNSITYFTLRVLYH